jgi:hypothetical protein
MNGVYDMILVCQPLRALEQLECDGNEFALAAVA